MKALNDGGSNSANGLKKLAKGAEIVEKINKLHADRQRLMGQKNELALLAGKTAKAEKLTALKVRKAAVMEANMDRHGQVF